MPRVADVSGSSRVRPILFSPSPINVSRCVCSRRIGLPVCWTLMVLVFAMTTSIRSRFAVDAGAPRLQRRLLAVAPRRAAARQILVLERIERGAPHVVGVGGADRFGDHVL